MQSKWRNVMGLAVGIIGLFAVGRYTSWYAQAASLCAYPALALHARIVAPVSAWAADRKTNAELRNAVAVLHKKCTILERSLAQMQAKRSYLQASGMLHAFNQRFNMHGQVVRIMARSLSEDGQYYLIDAGSRDHVQKDTMVVHNNIVVGKVSEVYPYHSKVCLITDADCKVGAYTASHRAQGIHEGRNDQHETALQFVDHLSQITEGELVFTSGAGLLFPEGFTLGTVSKVAPDGLYKRVSLSPACDFERIEYCMLAPK